MNPEQDQIKKLEAKWVNAVKTMDPRQVADLYKPLIGSLLGTVDTAKTGPRTGTQAIQNYFEHFLDRQTVEPHFPPVEQQNIQPLGDFIQASGYYSFDLTDHDGQQTTAHAKYTLIWNSEGQIILHNSGLTPDGIIPKKD